MANIVQENATSVAPHTSQTIAEFRALLADCGVYARTNRAQIKLAGKDRVRWLNGMITNNIRDLAVGSGVYGFLLNPQGRIQGDLYAYSHPEFLVVDTDKAQLETISNLFRRYIIMDKVELTDISNEIAVIEVVGQKSVKVLTAAGFELPKEALQFSTARWHDADCTIIRGDLPDHPSFEIWCSPDKSGALLAALITAGSIEVHDDAMELLRIAEGVPRFGQDIKDRDLPQETEQLRALNFAKGCYIGQEIVERIRSRGNVHRKFTGFLIEGPLPQAGAPIEIDGKSVGEITSVASLPHTTNYQNVALGYLRREFATPGNKIPIGESQATVSALPFTNLLKS